MSKKAGIIIGAVIAAAFVGVMGYAIYVEIKPELSKKANKVKVADLTDLIDSDAEVTPAEYYKYDMSASLDGANTSSMYLIFDRGSNALTYLSGSLNIADGTYETSGNEVACYTDDSEYPSMFLIDGNYLLLESGICYGDVPEGDTFDATFYQKTSQTTVFYYTFREDGTYTLRETIDDDEDPTDASVDGTYERDGDKIYTTVNDVTSFPYLVIDGNLCVSYYEEISESQYEEEYAANEAASESAE